MLPTLMQATAEQQDRKFVSIILYTAYGLTLSACAVKHRLYIPFNLYNPCLLVFRMIKA